MVPTIEILEQRIAPALLIAATTANNLLQFDSASPGTVETIPLTGLLGAAGETLVGIDFRPATGDLYGFTVDAAGVGQLYLIDADSGVATALGALGMDPAVTLSNTASYGFDFNPTVDRIRVVNSAGENFRINPNTGALAAPVGDSNLTAGFAVHGSAYDRSFAGSGVTTLFGLDVTGDQLVLQGSINGTTSPNGGVLTNVGPLGVDAAGASFDIESATGVAFAALKVGATTGLFTINLTTGAATSVGNIGTGSTDIVGLAVVTEQIQIVNPKVATYRDVDGDLVTIKITKGELTADLFELGAGPSGGAYLRTLNLSSPDFAGTNLTITAKRGPDGGNGLASIGYINASGNDLGTVKIAGDLTQMDAGNPSAGGTAIKNLQVTSFGVLSPLTSALDSESTIVGSIGKLTVKKDFRNAVLNVNDSAEDAVATIGKLTIGNSLVGGLGTGSGLINAEALGTVKIGRDIQGGFGEGSGILQANSMSGTITVGGSIRGEGSFSGRISVGDANKISIKGSLYGGDGADSGAIFTGDINALTIGGSVVGGSGGGAGRISAEGDVGTLMIKGSLAGGLSSGTATVAFGTAKKVIIGKSIIGGAEDTARIFSNNIDSLQIGGDVIGSTPSSATIGAENTIGNIVIRGSVTGSATEAATIGATTIGTVTINGSLIGTNEDSAAIRAGAGITKVVIGGNLFGDDLNAGRISVNEGDIGSLIVRGSVSGGTIFASGDINSAEIGRDVTGSYDGQAVIAANGTLESLRIRGSFRPDAGFAYIEGGAVGTIRVDGDMQKAVIDSDLDLEEVLIGGSMLDTSIISDGALGRLQVGGDLKGCASAEVGAVNAAGRIDQIRVGGSIGGSFATPNIFAQVIGELRVDGDVSVPMNGPRLLIFASGTQATSGTADVAIESIKIGGTVENVDILAGYSLVDGAVNADAQIGIVDVGGDWNTSNLVAGSFSENGVYGDNEDSLIGEPGQVTSIVASIASITIKGTVGGTFGGNDGFGFVAQEIKAVSIGGKKVSLESGPSNDALVPSPLAPDFRIRETGVL